MKILVNGEEREVPAGVTVEALLVMLGVEGRPVAVERNGELVRRGERAGVVLGEGDRVELVTLVGGG